MHIKKETAANPAEHGTLRHLRKEDLMIKILFVCHGNICRSPMAEFMLKDMVRKAGLEDQFEIASAATTGEEIWRGRGNPVYPPARRKLAEHGIGVPGNELGVSAKRARRMTAQDYARYDLLIGMDGENLSDMKEIAGGDPDHKIFRLLDFTDRPRSVADPWYTDDFDATWRDCREGLEGLLGYLEQSGRIHRQRSRR